jgi:ADP-ribose pyrophosphatase YjhB (NUDIX family)
MSLKAYPADYAQAVDLEPGILARGPWQAGQVATRWRADRYEAHPDRAAAADAALLALQDRGSPTHDGLAARLSGYEAGADGLTIELQPMRWALRLTPEDALGALSVLCAVRSADGRWLAGRRAAWVATWAGRWALGAGGAVEVGEDPVAALARELEEEWSVVPERLAVEALVCLPNRMTMLVGQAWLPRGAEVTRDHEHDAHAWWPADPAAWPPEADGALRRMAGLLGR